MSNISEMAREWHEAYAAFKGAFDTPQARMRQRDEYAEDARDRLRAFDEKFVVFAAKDKR